MLRRFALLCLPMLISAGGAARADDPPSHAQEAVRRGLAYVETKSMAWLHESVIMT